MLAYASLTPQPHTVLNIFDMSVLYCFYVVRTLFKQDSREVFEEQDIFEWCYDDIDTKQFLLACTRKDRALLKRSLEGADNGEMLGIRKGVHITERHWLWLFTTASVIEQKNMHHDKVTLFLQAAQVVKSAYQNAVAQPLVSVSNRNRHESRLSTSSPGHRLQF